MRKYNRKIPLFSLMMVALLPETNAVAKSTATMTVAAAVVQDIRIVRQEPLSFGAILQADTPGTVTVTSGGQRNHQGNLKLGNEAYQPAYFEIQGQKNQSYHVSIPTELYFKVAGGQMSLRVDNLKMESRNAPGTSDLGYLDGTGQDRLAIGGTLNVPANVEPGIYKGFVPISVSY
jgi:hypothetical protein